jgi:hypothetical protein
VPKRTLLPIGETVEFRIHKDKLLLRVPEAHGKEGESGSFHDAANGRSGKPPYIGTR